MATQVCETLQLKEIFATVGISADEHSFSKLFRIPNVSLLFSSSEEILFLINPKDLGSKSVAQLNFNLVLLIPSY